MRTVLEPNTFFSYLTAGQTVFSSLTFVIENDVAHQKSFRMLGEREGALFLDPSLAAGTPVVTQGRSALAEGDKVAAQVSDAQAPARPPPEGHLAGEGRP